MYKSIHTLTGEEIIILNPSWKRKINQLRGLDQQDLLVCQGCLQPLRVKAGEFKRPHFAHKHLQACSFGTESPEILHARAVLYTWLEKQFGEVASLEKNMVGVALPRPVDCWVESEGGAFAYWLVEAGIKLEPRQAIKSAFEGTGVKVHWVFLRKMLNEEKKEYQSVLLSPTERAFMQTTPFDEMEAGVDEPGYSMHYLDAKEEMLITYRGLTLFHRPNWFKGIKKSTKLDNIMASRIDGGMIHPGEITRLNSIREKKRRLENKRQKYQGRALDWENRTLAGTIDFSLGRGPDQSEQSPEYSGSPAALPCALCGQVTTDYWSTFFDSYGRKLCRCRECLDRSG